MSGAVALKAARLYISKVALRSVDAEAADSGQSPAQWYPVRRMMRTLHESRTHILIPWRRHGLAWINRMVRRDKSACLSQPVPLGSFPDELNIVGTPMDLRTLCRRLASGTCEADAAELREDRKLI